MVGVLRSSVMAYTPTWLPHRQIMVATSVLTLLLSTCTCVAYCHKRRRTGQLDVAQAGMLQQLILWQTVLLAQLFHHGQLDLCCRTIDILLLCFAVLYQLHLIRVGVTLKTSNFRKAYVKSTPPRTREMLWESVTQLLHAYCKRSDIPWDREGAQFLRALQVRPAESFTKTSHVS